MRRTRRRRSCSSRILLLLFVGLAVIGLVRLLFALGGATPTTTIGESLVLLVVSLVCALFALAPGRRGSDRTADGLDRDVDTGGHDSSGGDG